MKTSVEKYNDMQDAMVDAMGLKVGDTVTISRIAESDELGWGDSWVRLMDDFVGKKVVVEAIRRNNGITCNMPGQHNYNFPIQVIVPEVYKPKQFKISEDYTAVVTKNGTVEVGCQKVPFALLKEIYNAATAQVEL